MWELIQANKRKSRFIFLCMGLCLLLLGYLLGAVWFPPDGGMIGIAIAFGLWVVLSIVSYASGDSILLAASRARKVSPDVHPRLFNVVEEMKIAAGLPAMPQIYIIDEAAPNAFATGRSPEKSSIAVTAGLLSKLNRDELQGVVAHEMAHILNRDVLFMTFAGVLLGSIVMLSEIFLRSFWFSGGASRRYRSGRASKAAGSAHMFIMVATFALAILAPILARVFYFALSRKREYLADASAARLTRYPAGLASALEKISSSSLQLTSANSITAAMYIANPFQLKGVGLTGLFSTHPPIADRIQILQRMAHGANYVHYQRAFSRVKDTSASILPPSAAKESKDIPIREPSAEEPKREGMRAQKRDLGDLMRAVNKYAFLACVCGLTIKVPPDFKDQKFGCPRCKREVEVPLATVAAALAGLGATMEAKGGKAEEGQPAEEMAPQIYFRKGDSWESFPCACGKVLQLSPLFRLKTMTCSDCGRKTEIKGRGREAVRTELR